MLKEGVLYCKSGTLHFCILKVKMHLGSRWPGVEVDIMVMYKIPLSQLENLAAPEPQVVLCWGHPLLPGALNRHGRKESSRVSCFLNQSVNDHYLLTDKRAFFSPSLLIRNYNNLLFKAENT